MSYVQSCVLCPTSYFLFPISKFFIKFDAYCKKYTNTLSMNKNILISLITLTIGFTAAAQTVTGVVSDKADAVTLIGATVYAKGTSNATITDIDGNYSLTLQPGQDTLEVSYVGYTTLIVPVSGRSVINIELSQDVELLEEVVVIGYGIQKKSDMTGSVSTLRGEDLTKIPSFSAEQALQGKIAGLQVASVSGAPGAIPILRIRGVGTLNNSAPIFVVDGVILDDISFLNSSDIQSMEVLKDASSTAIYGSRGANGVIIVTTKNGSSTIKYDENKPAPAIINVSSEFSIQHLQNQIDMLSGREFAEVVNEINPGTFNNLDKVADTDWQNEIFKAYAPIQSYHASIGGSTGKYDYYFGVGYFLQSGIIDNSSYERLTLKSNNKYSISKNISIGTNLTIAPDQKQNEAGVVPIAYRAWPTSVPLNADGTYAEVFGAGNPLAAIEYNNSYTSRIRAVGNLFTDITFLKSFVYRSSFGFDETIKKDKSFTPEFYISPSQSNALNDLNVALEQTGNWLWENTINYSKTINKHSFNALAGITAQKNKLEVLSAGIQNLIGEDSALWYISAGEAEYLTASNRGEITAMASYLGRVNYTYNNTYLFTASIRRDGSSKFGINNRWGNFPSFALGWNLANEAFMADVKKISRVKLRASWGIIGNEKIPWSRQYSLVDNNINAVFGIGEDITQGATYGVSGNPDLQWENTTQTDVGLELGFFDNKLTSEFDYYRKITDGILVDLLTPGHLGNGPYTTVTYNAAEVLNNGFEWNVGWNERRGDLYYKITVLGSTLHNEVLSLGDTNALGGFIPSGALGNGQLVTRTVIGQPVGAFYGYEVAGVFQTEDEVNTSPHIAGQTEGDLKFTDQNNDGIIDDKDRVYIGSYIPDLIYGFSLEVAYKAFDIALDFNGQMGSEIYNGKKAVRPDLYNFETNLIDRWTGEGTSDTEPRATAGGTNYEASDYFIESGDFFRLRSATVSYNFNKSFLTRLHLTNASVYLRGTNLFTLSEYSGYSPEIASSNALASGIDLGVYPITSVYSFGINFNF